MQMVTFLYWFRTQRVGGKNRDIVVAECSRCGLRVSAQCPGTDGPKQCAEMLRARCRKNETNSYVTSILEPLLEA